MQITITVATAIDMLREAGWQFLDAEMLSVRIRRRTRTIAYIDSLGSLVSKRRSVEKVDF